MAAHGGALGGARLALRSAAGLLVMLAVIALAILGPERSLRDGRAWAYIATFGACCVAITADLLRRDRGLLERRLHAGPTAERDPAQRLLSALTSVGFLAMYVASGLDARHGWSRIPRWGSVLADLVVVVGFAVVWATFRANSYTSATIAVAEGQTVAERGPYAVVRHPMYAGALLMLAATPPALGSWVASLAVVVMIVGIGARAVAEERYLVDALPGYAAYRARVRWRLVPGVW